jgi:Domain of unknown function (DUF4340)
MNNFQRILAGLLVAQLAIIAFVFWPRPAASSGGEPLLGALKASDITGMTITDDKGVSTKLVKQGQSWVAPDAANYPADATKITPVLDKLVAIKMGRAVATTAASHAQLQVADNKFMRKIDLTKADGSAQTVYLGSAAGQSVHARLGGKNEVYLANGLATYEANADLLSWINPVYLSLNANDVTGLTLKNKNGEFALTKDPQGQWQLAGLSSEETLDANKVSSLVTAATSVRMTKPLGKTEDPAWGLKAPLAVVTMQVKSGDQTKPVILTVGAQDTTDQSYVVKSSESEYYVRAPDYSAQEFVSRDKAAFLTATPTPAVTTAPAAGATPTP